MAIGRPKWRHTVSREKKYVKLTQPSEIDGNFFSEVFPNVIQRLVLVPLAPTGPVMVQDLPDIELRWRGPSARMFKRTLKRKICDVIVNPSKGFLENHLSLLDNIWNVRVVIIRGGSKIQSISGSFRVWFKSTRSKGTNRKTITITEKQFFYFIMMKNNNKNNGFNVRFIF